MGRLTPEDAELTAALFEELFAELRALRDITHEEIGETLLPGRVNVAAVRVGLLNLLDVATEQDLKGTALDGLPAPEKDDEEWEWALTRDLVVAISAGMGSLVRDISALRAATREAEAERHPGRREQQAPRGVSSLGRELDVKRFRMAWETLAARQLEGDGAAIHVVDTEDRGVGIKVLFEPPMTNPFKNGNSEDDLTPAQIVVGNMMAYAFQQRDVEEVE